MNLFFFFPSYFLFPLFFWEGEVREQLWSFTTQQGKTTTFRHWMFRCWFGNSCSAWIDDRLRYSLNFSFCSFIRRVLASCGVMLPWLGVYAKISHSGKMLLGLAIAACFSLGLLAFGIPITNFRADVSYINCTPVWKHCIATCQLLYFLEQTIVRMKRGRYLWGRCYEPVLRSKFSKAQPYLIEAYFKLKPSFCSNFSLLHELLKFSTAT